LAAQGINNWALTKAQALLALDEWELTGIPIAGGDVMKPESDRIIHTYDNWSCELRPNESEAEYCLRSYKETRKYITNYNIDFIGQIYFCLVPNTKNR